MPHRPWSRIFSLILSFCYHRRIFEKFELRLFENIYDLPTRISRPHSSTIFITITAQPLCKGRQEANHTGMQEASSSWDYLRVRQPIWMETSSHSSFHPFLGHLEARKRRNRPHSFRNITISPRKTGSINGTQPQ